MNTKTRDYGCNNIRFDFTSILQGHYISEKVYSFIQMVDRARLSTKNLVKRWIKNSTGRRELARLDNRMLRDIGLEPYEVAREIQKPFWRS